MKNILFPTLDVIKRNLFTPSDALVTQWVEKPDTLSTEIRHALENSELAQQEKQSYLAGKAFSQTQKITFASESDALSKVPSHIKNLILRHCDATTHTFSTLPNSGLMVLINEAMGLEGTLALDVANPMVALLNQPTEHQLVWTGWIIASETDYASCWDMLLDPEKDAPLDPIVGMVQTWNAVQIYLPSIEKIIGELTPKRLTMVGDLANEYQFEHTDVETTIPSEPGRLVSRLVNNNAIVTGTPLSANLQDDPRWEYQKLYDEAANAIRKTATLAEGIDTHSMTDVINTTITFFKDLPLIPRVQFAMSDSDDEQFDYGWGDDNTYRISMDEQKEDGEHFYAVVIKLEKKITHPVTFEYRKKNVLAHQHVFSNESNETSFLCHADEDYEFILTSPTGDQYILRP